jgi:D-lactate dehydrogenase
MIRIAHFHTLAEEEPFAQAWAETHHVQVDCLPVELHEDTVALAEDYTGISFKQRSPIGASEVTYPLLRSFGIRQIAVRSAGIDSIDLQAAKDNDITITNVPSYSPSAVAQLVLTQVMTLIRQIPQFEHRTAQGDLVVSGLMSRELSELTIGIIGVGRIGSTVARIFHALGAQVLGNDIVEHDELSGILTYVDKSELLANSDVVTLHTYLDDSTYHLINEHNLKLLKPTAYLVNASRGPVVDTDALIRTLREGSIAGAALDVVEGEQPLFNNRFPGGAIPDERYRILQGLENVLLTPHVGFFTDIAVKNMVQQSLDDALAIIQGGTSKHEIHLH